jgi:hypothetical protein
MQRLRGGCVKRRAGWIAVVRIQLGSAKSWRDALRIIEKKGSNLPPFFLPSIAYFTFFVGAPPLDCL